jgi:hypothetical protein
VFSFEGPWTLSSGAFSMEEGKHVIVQGINVKAL